MLAALARAPLFLGWVNQCRAWLQNRSAPSLLLPYRGIRKLFHKDAVIAETRIAAVPRGAVRRVRRHGGRRRRSSRRWARGCRSRSAADAIALVGLLAIARVFMSLAAMDIGTAFGTLGARREMMVGFLAEPALLMVIFVASLHLGHDGAAADRRTACRRRRSACTRASHSPAVAFTMVLLAENARIPVDNPATHLELTMIHEAMLLEYSARHLALMEWAAALKLFNYACIGFALFVPWGVRRRAGPGALLPSVPVLGLKLLVAGVWLAVLETVSAKLRVFRAPEFLATAFMFAVLGLLVHLLLGA